MPEMSRASITREPGLIAFRVRPRSIQGFAKLSKTFPHGTYSISKLIKESPEKARHFVNMLKKVGVDTVTTPRDPFGELIELGLRFRREQGTEEKPRLDLSDVNSYQLSLLLLTARELASKFGWDRCSYLNTSEIAPEMQQTLLEFPRLSSLRMELAGGDVRILPTDGMQSRALGKALYGILCGAVLTEHQYAGEATRLGLGTKALLTPEELIEGAKSESVPFAEEKYTSLATLTLGSRHMAQFAYDLMKLARPAGMEPSEVLKNQWLLVPINEATQDQVISMFVDNNYYHFDPEQVIFVTQRSFPGMSINRGELSFDHESDKRLYNHGALAMQTGMDNELFLAKPKDSMGGFDKNYISSADYLAILKQMKNKVAFPVEDLRFLGGAIDLQALAMAYEAAVEGYHMVMEVVGQTDPPQKGGFLASDRDLKRPVMIESDQGGWLVNEKDKEGLKRIRALNRNFNMFPHPWNAQEALMEFGLPLHLTLKGRWLYPQPPQGDQNFLVPTLYFRRENVKQISGLKIPTDIPKTLDAFSAQDRQGFLETMELIR
jgi:hypothetical protein